MVTAQAFLLFKDVNAANWSHVLLENRNSYSALREHYLKYIKHPELLNQLSLDPLADDPDVRAPSQAVTSLPSCSTSSRSCLTRATVTLDYCPE